MTFRKFKSALVLGALAFVMTAPAIADQWPLAGGDYWEVTGIRIKDGGGFKYAQFIAGEWKANSEFSKSKGWIKGYKIFANAYPREGEPDLYLVTIRDSIVAASEDEKRNDEFQAWKKKTIEQMQTESGNRVEFREILGNELLQELTIR